MRMSDSSSDVCSSDLDEDIARHDFEARACRVGPALVIAGDDDPLAGIFHQDLRAAEHMPRGMEAEAHPAAFEAVAIFIRLLVARLGIDARAQGTEGRGVGKEVVR